MLQVIKYGANVLVAKVKTYVTTHNVKSAMLTSIALT